MERQMDTAPRNAEVPSILDLIAADAGVSPLFVAAIPAGNLQGMGNRMNIADLSRAAANLPMTRDNLQGLISIAERAAFAMYEQGGMTCADVVHAHLVDAFEAIDDMEPITLDMLSEWALADSIQSRKAA